MKSDTQNREPFVTSWLGISLQLFVTVVLIILTVYLWRL